MLPPPGNTPPPPIGSSSFAPDARPFTLLTLVLHTNGLTCSKHSDAQGYADDDNASPSSSLAAFTGAGARASPSGNSSDLLVDSDAPDEVAIHVDSTGTWDGKPRAWPPVPGYDWVPHEVRQLPSSFYDRQAFRNLINHICLVKTAADARHFKLAICQRTERVCHGRGNYPNDFFYVYATMFKDLKLHPNGSAFMQEFSAICSGLALKPTSTAFLYFFHVQPHPSKPWVSLRTVGNKHLLTLYNSSYKDFKNHFFKVVPTETGYQSLCSSAQEAKFPFYWTRDPRKVLSWPKPQMTPEDLDLINQLCQLPPKSSCRVLIGFLGNKNLPSNVFDYLSKMDPSKNSTFARLFAQRGGEVRKPGGSSSHAPSTVVAPATSRPTQQTSVPPPPVEVVPDQAPPIESHPKKKAKRKAAREASAESQQAKRRMPDGPPLPGLLSPNSWVAKRLHFNLFTEEKTLVSGMTEEEASNMSLELTTQLALCQTYAAQKKASASAELQALQAKFDSTFKANQDLTLRLAETERMAEEDKKKTSTLLAEARATQHRMQRSLDDAKLDLQKATSSNATLTAERDSLRDQVTKLEAEVKLLGDEVVKRRKGPNGGHFKTLRKNIFARAWGTCVTTEGGQPTGKVVDSADRVEAKLIYPIGCLSLIRPIGSLRSNTTSRANT
ncbi:hypothetical protein LR48_Vigan01g150900 [Vigna angularis]|uniref:Uncharacterized protein n=1 Tax=Phaseolus angularis TaxID=3914 RepID=A0A0L9TN18_PHAAN|nr:hypothetical protein LR48_Vigan01g150900 [Vigna angularis]